MNIRNLLLPLAAFGMMAAPVAASAAPIGNPAASLSVTRASAPADKGSDLFGSTGGAAIFGIVILAGIIAIIVIGATNGDGNSSSP